MTQLSDFLLNSEMRVHVMEPDGPPVSCGSSSLIIACCKGNGMSLSRRPQLFVAESYGELPLYVMFWGDGAHCRGREDGRKLGGGGKLSFQEAVLASS